jgi:hypothetical protein
MCSAGKLDSSRDSGVGDVNKDDVLSTGNNIAKAGLCNELDVVIMRMVFPAVVITRRDVHIC